MKQTTLRYNSVFSKAMASSLGLYPDPVASYMLPPVLRFMSNPQMSSFVDWIGLNRGLNQTMLNRAHFVNNLLMQSLQIEWADFEFPLNEDGFRKDLTMDEHEAIILKGRQGFKVEPQNHKIIILGAGLDSASLRFGTQTTNKQLQFLEVDLPEVVREKKEHIVPRYVKRMNDEGKTVDIADLDFIHYAGADFNSTSFFDLIENTTKNEKHSFGSVFRDSEFSTTLVCEALLEHLDESVRSDRFRELFELDVDNIIFGDKMFGFARNEMTTSSLREFVHEQGYDLAHVEFLDRETGRHLPRDDPPLVVFSARKESEKKLV